MAHNRRNKTLKIYYNNNPDVENIIDRLMQWPFQEIGPKKAQTLGKFKAMRFLKEKEFVKINNGNIGLRRGPQFEKHPNFFKIKFKL